MNTHRNTREQKAPRAFTLIELLVVVAIIGILAALLSRTVFHVVAKDQEAACQNNLRQLAVLLWVVS